LPDNSAVFDERQLRLAFEAGRLAVWDFDVASGRMRITPELKTLLGYSGGAVVTQEDIQAGYDEGDWAAMAAAARAALRRGETSLDADMRYAGPDGVSRSLLLRAEMLQDDEGRVTKGFGVVVDVTEQKNVEERLRLLTRELDHRANNLLTVVQSLIGLSKADSIDAFREVLLGRVDALARTHQLLAADSWRGADLKELVKRELRPYVADGAAMVEIEGPPCSLAPAQAQSIALVLHELATNAAKYGSLSVETGSVAVTWVVRRDAVQITWTESGGPRVEPPRSKGFGTTLLERALTEHPGGSVTLNWLPAGLSCDLVVPLTDPRRRAGPAKDPPSA
jgi:PAS domain S-box-containing protein